MNKPMLTIATALAALVLISTPASAKKKPVDLSIFKGNYSGTVVLSESGTSLSSPVSIQIKPNKKGTMLTLIYSSVLSNGGTTIPLSTVINLTAKGTASTSDIVFGLGMGTTLPGTGTANFTKRGFTFSTGSSFSGTTYTFGGTATVKDHGKKRSMALALTLQAGSTSISLVQDVTAKAPKN